MRIRTISPLWICEYTLICCLTSEFAIFTGHKGQPCHAGEPRNPWPPDWCLPRASDVAKAVRGPRLNKGANKILFGLELKRTSDQRRGYGERGGSRPRTQHDILIKSLEKVAKDAEGDNGGWKIRLIIGECKKLQRQYEWASCPGDEEERDRLRLWTTERARRSSMFVFRAKVGRAEWTSNPRRKCMVWPPW